MFSAILSTYVQGHGASSAAADEQASPSGCPPPSQGCITLQRVLVGALTGRCAHWSAVLLCPSGALSTVLSWMVQRCTEFQGTKPQEQWNSGSCPVSDDESSSWQSLTESLVVWEGWVNLCRGGR